MMQYKYRWFYAVGAYVIILIAGFFYGINPALTELAELTITDKNLTQQLAIIKQNALHINKPHNQHPINQTDVLSNVLMLAHLNGLNVKAINFVSQKAFKPTDTLIIKVALDGDFQQISAFLFALANQTNPLLVVDFIYKWTQKNTMRLVMDVVILKENIQPFHSSNHDEEMARTHNPFCFATNPRELAFNSGPVSTQVIPIQQMKMVGYVQQDKRKQALVMLPNSNVVAIELGTMLGKERGVVTVIEKREIVVLAEGKQFLLKM